MKKLILIILLMLIDLILGYYLFTLNSDRKAFIYSLPDVQYLVQLEQVRLNSIEEFNFDNYFKIISFYNKYSYSYDDNYIYINLDKNKEYRFKYEILEPEVIEKIVYKEVEKEVVKQDDYVEQDFFYVNEDRLIFNKDTDLEIIRNELIDNIVTTQQTNIDYSRLNVSHVGQYSVFYIGEDSKIQIIVEIV